MVMKDRMGYVDMARGVAIILVMTGHSILFPACGAIHIPTFFVLAGYVITMESIGKNTFKGCIGKRALRLLYPYGFYSLLLFLLNVVKELAAGSLSIKELGMDIFGVVYSSTYIWNREENQFLCFRIGNEGLWFLTAMVSACLVFYILLYFVYDRKWNYMKAAISVVLLTGASLLLEQLPLFLPWGFDIALIGVAFMLFGMAIRRSGLFLERRSAVWVVPLSALGFLLLNGINGEANMAIHLYGMNRGLFWLSGICSALFIMSCCRLLEEVPPIEKGLSYVGRNTLFILAFHTTFYGVYDKLFDLAGVEFTGLWIVRLVLTLAGCLLGQWVLEKLFRVPRKLL